jgi:chromosome segregation ATPase
MSWILKEGKPVKVRWEGPQLVTADGTPIIADDVEIFDTRKAARDARPRPPSIDRQVEDLARVMGVGDDDPDNILLHLKTRAVALAKAEKSLEAVAHTLDCGVNVVLDRVIAHIAVHRDLDKKFQDLWVQRDAARGQAAEAEAEAHDRRKRAVLLENDVADLRAQLAQARREIWALELKAEALHCHQVMLAAERQRLRQRLAKEG